MNVLLIEDEPKVVEFIRKGLTENGCNVTVSYDGKTGKRMAIQEDYDVIILDIMLPSINGLEVCEQLRKEQVRVPIIMLSALGTVDDKVEGLQRGADDYMVKPFHFKELLSRIHALTRRNNKNIYTTSSLSFADLHLDRERKIAIRGKKEIILTAKEYGLLELFIVNSNRVLSRSFIAEKVWGNDFDASSNVIDVLINYLRNKIDKGFPNKLIHTVVGMGYSMKES
jgi:two-component system, OmpR family, copper resistance phosphate regulon response regulator CusR